jgi:hypothetical protein
MNTSPPHFRRNKRFLAERQIDDEYVLVNTDTGNVHQLNPVAACIWRGLEENSSLRTLADAVAQEFSVEPAKALRDVELFVAELFQLELIEHVEE